MGIQSDKEIAELIAGSSPELLDLLAPSLEESASLKIFTQTQALEYLGAKIKLNLKTARVGIKRNLTEEARELLANTVLAHVPVHRERGSGVWNFKSKCIYLAVMIRRVLLAVGGGKDDDRDFVGNKRLEL